MTSTPEDPNDRDESASPRDPGAGPDRGAGRRLDEDAAWRDIVAHFGDRPAVDPVPETPGPPPAEGRDERLRGLFRPSWKDPLDSEATWDDEGHFLPPDPPPVHVADPRRRAAWFGLFGSPFVMLVAVVLGWQLPGWLMLGLTGAFAGGFVYLVATMQNRPGGPGDDGAVV
jgi:hypothetical protein